MPAKKILQADEEIAYDFAVKAYKKFQGIVKLEKATELIPGMKGQVIL